MRNLLAVALLLLVSCNTDKKINTVNGTIDADELGKTLSHEHIMVDFIGADSAGPGRYNREDVINMALPYLKELKGMGYQSIVECTPAYLGRDVHILKALSEKSGLNILTNTGYYGAQNNKFLPEHAFNESAEQLARRWIKEFEEGIDGTDIKPGFIKISVDQGPELSEIHTKLVKAAAITHFKTGLSIMSHTGTYETAVPQLKILQNYNVAPSAFIWTHANVEKNYDLIVSAAQKGVWVAFDGFRESELDHFMRSLKQLKANKLLDKVLLSHDAGWYDVVDPSKPYRSYSDIENILIPAMKKEGFTDDDINQIFVKNPASAFAIDKRLQ